MSAEFTHVKDSLVDKILTQGQRLRNAMVQSILQNDPFCSDIIYNKVYNTPVTSASTLASKDDKKLLEVFISGDYLTKAQEDLALNTIRSLSLSDVCETTEKALVPNKCSCATCAAYYKNNNLKCDLRRSPNCAKLGVKNNIVDNTQRNILKQVDSLKVILQSIHLNNLGNKKVAQGLNKRLNETYFVEYYIPEVFTKEVPKSKSKTDSGLENSHVRVCARRTSNVIHIRQVFMHSVCNLYDCNLDDHELIFSVRYKSTGQKNSELLGVAKFNLGLFKNAKNASVGKTLPIYLHEESPISVGTLKVTLQLGAGKLYFGQEFLDAVLLPKRSSNTSDSSEEISDIPSYENKLPIEELVVPEKANKKEPKSEKAIKIKPKPDEKPKAHSRPIIVPVVKPDVAHFAYFRQNKSEDVKARPVEDKDKNQQQPPVQSLNREFEGDILFGFLYISEAQFLNLSPNSFILCQPYCQNDTSTSRVVYNNSNPLYNFCQTIPLLYEEPLLLNLRENFMLIEFWERSAQTDQLFGLTRLPLHQFYLGYRNAIILKHLKRNKLPIIGTDWWEPIYSVDNNELIGQVQVLTALGTEDQIKNLELERGFKDDLVKAKFLKSTQIKAAAELKRPINYSSYVRDWVKVNKNPLKPLNTTISKTDQKPQKCDVAIQSDLEERSNNMDLKSNSSNKLPETQQEMITSFLKLLEQRQRPPCVENSTNTEADVCSGTSSHQVVPTQAPPQLRKTSDLLDTLHKALSLDSIGVPARKVEKPPTFKARISINSANQLPSRRKIKSNKARRAKGKSPKQEDNNILPSTYVTFETLPREPLQVTSVCPKSTSPQWNFRCDVCLPLDLLTNGQKRLIFKVWKKCTNAVLQPNMQADLVLGFAAVDLSVLSVGLPSVQGWFNILDFSGKCNGQINIHVNPIDKVRKINNSQPQQDVSRNVTSTNNYCSISKELPESEECNELLSRALKRKFTELDEITQRLRLRLSEVVSDDSDGSNDDITDEFEQDINNLCVEDDFDLINFEVEAKKFSNNNNQCQKAEQKGKLSNTNSILSCDVVEPGTSQPTRGAEISQEDFDPDKLKSDSSGLLAEGRESGTPASEPSTSKSLLSDDKPIIEGKHRIDSLLQKLSLITAEASQPFTSRYVSGCSAASNDPSDVQDIFKDLELHSRPNITAANSFDPVLFQQLYGGSISAQASNLLLIDSKSSNSNNTVVTGSGSETSVITNFSDCRPNPDGQGVTSSDDKGT